METISEEYITQKEQELLSLYKKYNKEEQESKLFTENYINVLKACQGIGSSNPLTRERSRESFPLNLESLMQLQNQIEAEIFEKALQEAFVLIDVMLHASKIESKAGAITAATFILQKYEFKDFEDKIFNACIEALFKHEYILTPQILGYFKSYTKKYGPSSFEKLKDDIYEFVNKLWSKYSELRAEEEAFNKIEDPKNVSPIARKEFFKACSETNLGFDSFYKILLTFIEEIPNNSPLIDSNLLTLIYKTKQHQKQEIRSLGCDVVGAMITKIPNEVWNEQVTSIGNFIIGLMGDEYTTVRHQATLNVSKFVERAAETNNLTQFTSLIVPRILMNRYHVAETLSKESVALWRLFLEKIGNPTGGRELLGKLSKEACEFYVAQMKSTHHEVLKAACFALRELTSKVEESTPAVSAQYDEILEVFLTIAKHDNPSVRSTCFGVLDSLAIKCPEQSRKRMNDLLNVGFFQICFNYKSEETAESIALYLVEIYKAFKEDVHQMYLDRIREKLHAFEKGEELIQVREETQPIIYRGELIRPKGFEVTTGALILLSELITVNKEIADPNLDILHAVVSLRKSNYYEGMVLYAWKVFRKAFGVWDKKTIKSEIEIVLEPLFRDITNPKPKITSEAAQILRDVANKIGVNILKARIENIFDSKYSKEVDMILSANQ